METTNLTIHYPKKPEEFRCRYEGQRDYQPAYFELSEDGTLSANYISEPGNYGRCPVFGGNRWGFKGEEKLAEVRTCMATIAPLCEELLEAESGEEKLAIRDQIELAVKGFFEKIALQKARKEYHRR